MLKVLNTIVLLAMYVMSYLSTATNVLGPQSTNLSTAFPFSFLPPGVVFSVARTAIYILLARFAIKMRRKDFSEQSHKKLLRLVMLVNLLNIAWLITTAQQMFVISVVIMIIMTILLIMAMNYIRRKGMQKSIVRATIGAYYGWVSVATIALGLSQLVYIYNKPFAMTDTWMYIAVGLGVLLTIISWIRWKNVYSLLFSLMGICGAVWARFMGR